MNYEDSKTFTAEDGTQVTFSRRNPMTGRAASPKHMWLSRTDQPFGCYAVVSNQTLLSHTLGIEPIKVGDRVSVSFPGKHDYATRSGKGYLVVSIHDEYIIALNEETDSLIVRTADDDNVKAIR